MFTVMEKSKYIIERFDKKYYRLCMFDEEWIYFNPTEGAEAVIERTPGEEISGVFRKLAGDWYFCYTRSGSCCYAHVAGRTFIGDPPAL